MSLWERITSLISRAPTYRPVPPTPRLVFTKSCVAVLSACMEPEIREGHEGIVYLAGLSDSTTTVAVAAIRPQARTTRGSFSVESASMAQVVRAALGAGLQLVGQLHTHPGEAYHSDGDVEGARIAYTGYVSVVLPDYGRRLPRLDGAAAYMYRGKTGFVTLEPQCITIAAGRLP